MQALILGYSTNESTVAPSMMPGVVLWSLQCSSRKLYLCPLLRPLKTCRK
jgi:hypothetical protein